jgi:hypothetical protein
MALHFTKVHIEFDSLGWLAMNVGKCDREGINGIIKVENIDGVLHLVHTDRYRMAILKYERDCPLEEGYYKIVKKSYTELLLNKIEQDCYPNWQSVLPDISKCKQIFKPDGSFTFFDRKNDNDLPIDICYLLGEKIRLNYTYLESIGKFFERPWEVYDGKTLVFMQAEPDRKLDEKKNPLPPKFYKYSLLLMKMKLREKEDD